MSSDRARVSYEPSRHWRGVINQQGRVTLEADWNEARAIAAESERAQLVDVVGPSGTPDDGYRVDVAGSGDLTIRQGTMYVGGERMTTAGADERPPALPRACPEGWSGSAWAKGVAVRVTTASDNNPANSQCRRGGVGTTAG